MKKQRPFVVVLLIIISVVIFVLNLFTLETKTRTIGFVISGILIFSALIVSVIKQSDK